MTVVILSKLPKKEYVWFLMNNSKEFHQFWIILTAMVKAIILYEIHIFRFTFLLKSKFLSSMPLLKYDMPCFMYVRLSLFKKSARCFFLGTHLMPVHFRSYKSWHEVPLWAPGGWSSRNKFTRAMRAVSLPLENCAAQWLSKSRPSLDKKDLLYQYQ